MLLDNHDISAPISFDYQELNEPISYSMEGMLKDPIKTIEDSDKKFSTFDNYINNILNKMLEDNHELSKHLIDLLERVKNYKYDTINNNTVNIPSNVYRNLSKDDRDDKYFQGFTDFLKLLSDKKKTLGPILFIAENYFSTINENIINALKTKNGFSEIDLLDKDIIGHYKESFTKRLITPPKDFYHKVERLSESPALITVIDENDYLGNKRTASIFIANRNDMVYSFWSTLLQVKYKEKLSPQLKALDKKDIIKLVTLLLGVSKELDSNLIDAKKLLPRVKQFREQSKALQLKLIAYSDKESNDLKDVSDCERLLTNFYAHPFSYYFPMQQLRRQCFDSIKAGYEFSIKCLDNLK